MKTRIAGKPINSFRIFHWRDGWKTYKDVDHYHPREHLIAGMRVVSHRSIGDPWNWTVTHASSGLGAAVCPTRRRAVALARKRIVACGRTVISRSAKLMKSGKTKEASDLLARAMTV